MIEKLDVRERFHNIDFLRVVLINAIIIFHFYRKIAGVENNGLYGVELFFIISGFVFNMGWSGTKTTLEFVVKKLILFCPLLFVSSTILAIIRGFSIQRLLADIFLLQKTGLYVLDKGVGYNAPAWFIAVLFWVLLFIFYLRKTTSERTTNLIVGVLAFFSLISVANGFKFCCGNLIRGFGMIAIGYFGAEFCKALPKSDTKKSKVLSLVEAGLFGYVFFILFSTYKIKNMVAIVFLMGILVVLFYLKKGYLSSLLNKKIFTEMSVWVFPVFITHGLWYREPCLSFLKSVCHDNTRLLLVVGIAISWIMGIVLYHLIQKPCQKYLTKKFLKTKCEVAKEG